MSPAAKKTTIGAAIAMGNGEVERWGARREGEEQVMAEEAAFEIFIPCRLMAFSAVDRMEELGRARREEGGRKFSCEWVPWRAGEGEARIYSGRRPQKAITVTTTAETSGKKRERRKKFYRAT